MSLQTWLSNGWLTAHKTSPQEIADLLAIADRDLSQARTPGLSPDWQLNIAYNAALQSAVAALAASGFRASRENKHYRVIQSLKHTVDFDPPKVILFDQFRKKRNLSDYERAGLVSEQEAKEMLALAEEIRHEVKEWLKTNYPSLLMG